MKKGILAGVLAMMFMMAMQAFAGTVQLPQTGQTTCWDASGNAISCAGTGQDGEKRAGAAWPVPRFSDNGDQTMTDNLTGLIWTKDGNAPGPTACAPGTTKTWQGALDYVACLNSNNYLNHSDWRLPNRKELKSLVNRQQSNSAAWLNDQAQGFSNVQSNGYWSSSTYANFTSSAWVVNMGYGHVGKLNKAYGNYVWPVRGGQIGSFVPGPLGWPVACIPGINCTITNFTDINSDGLADCYINNTCRDVPNSASNSTYIGHQGTDFSITQEQMDAGVNAIAAADGVVKWVFDGYADHCSSIDSSNSQCQAPVNDFEPGQSSGYRRCTALGNFCGTGTCCCFWCFNGGNVVVIEHPGKIFTRYDHLKKNSIVIIEGQTVVKGQKIAQVGDAGNSTGPHLHFEVWNGGYYTSGNYLACPWQSGLWANNPAWTGN